MLLFACAVVLLLVVLNGIFAMSELAVVSSRRAKLQSRADRGDKGAQAALKLSDDPTRFLSAVQVGITLIGILAGAYGQATIASELDKILETSVPALAPYSEGISTGIVVVILTYLSLIVGELVPKRVALIFPETIAGVVAQPLSWMAMAMGPFVTLLTGSTTLVLRVLGIKDEKGETITQEEVETALAEGMGAGLIEPAEQQMMTEVMRLGDRVVRVAMTPRPEVYWVSLDDPEAVVIDDIRACPYSRFVVVRGQDFENPVGVAHKRDIADAFMRGEKFNLEALVHDPIFIPDTTSLLHALELFKGSKVHIALVVNEFGTIEGVLTPTDLLEMIAGDFDEAHDDGRLMIVRREDGSFLVDGRADLMELGDAIGENFESGAGFHTVAGLILNELGRFPKEGEIVRVGPYDIEIVDMDERRIDKVLFHPENR
ncbi:hemolysin family protein [Asticcacaulis sp. SL142]|uniref:hemolysin family protein n=1 Tax=Asticcacaulis sp. SL142 TaxID=2995155 RepID=UPI00226C7F8D|nr:hemolysin family protein [Asticcacaulis sp. SL142]WAC48573.1 hemolysin family protein [Asticcacaulis sp. SL142]